MALMTTLSQLEEVQAAISAVLKMQSYNLDGQSVSYANLDMLQKREEYLLKKYYNETTRNNPRVSYVDLSQSN